MELPSAPPSICSDQDININEVKSYDNFFNESVHSSVSREALESPPSSADENAESQSIAIVGMACRLPGGANSPSKLWDMLIEGRSGQCDIPSSRFNADAFYHPDGVNRPGSMNTKGGYFLQEDIRNFDNSFFGINNLEATYMDPQQRKLLEVVFECFESAGAPLEAISGSNTGCYVGNFTVDYQVMQTRDPEYLHRYSATGMGTTLLGNRVSHVFNLQGPSMVLDTACSSSLYCLHVACTALENGECDAAVVAGANLIQSPEQHLGTMKAGVLSGTSTCHTFDISADGYGRADGVGALYLKRLSDAVRDGDPIRSIVRGTAINSNGRTPGITLPSAIGQEAVIRKAYEKAGLDVNQTTYLECHGTGTAVGDPIEVDAISRVFKDRGQHALLIGSVKSNLGHSEAASGISSIIKTTLALEHSKIPATFGVKELNNKITQHEPNVRVVTKNTSWPVRMTSLSDGTNTTCRAPRRASINSFGYGGANAHAILESAELWYPMPQVRSCARKKFLIPVSAGSSESLKHRVASLCTLVSQKKDIHIIDLAYTLGIRRSHLTERSYFVLDSGSSEVWEAMRPDNLHVLPAERRRNLSELHYAYIFTGQGSQWPQMGKELIEEFPSFCESIAEMDNVLQSLPDRPAWTLKEALLEPAATSRIHAVSRSQPACTAVQVALVKLLARWGMTPSGVVGHSSGEIAAAYAAGLITEAQAIIIAYYRGYVVEKNAMEGAMMAAGLGRNTAEESINDVGLTGKVCVACINSPESVTFSGDADAIDTMFTHLQNKNIFVRKLNTGGRAYHSQHMKALGEEYEFNLHMALSNVPASDPTTSVRFISSVLGEPVTSYPQPSYWRSNLESPVLFDKAVEKLVQGHQYHLIELGPHSALELPINQIRSKMGVDESDLPYGSALTRFKDAVSCILSLMGNLYLLGLPVAFEKVNAWGDSIETGTPQVLVDLPPYDWTYDEILWNECRTSDEFRHRKYPRHELLGSQIPGGNGVDVLWRNVLRLKEVTWLTNHMLDQTIVFPGAGYVAMSIEAVCQATNAVPNESLQFDLRQVNILTALVLPGDGTMDEGIEIFTTLKPLSLSAAMKSKKWWDFEIVSVVDGSSTIHATGQISTNRITSSSSIARELYLMDRSMEPAAVRNWYDKLGKEGLNFGKSFQSIRKVYNDRTKRNCHTVTDVDLLRNVGPHSDFDIPYVVHPITLDAMLQTSIIASTAGNIHELHAKVPVMIESASIRTPLPSSSSGSWQIESIAEPMGFGSAKIQAELHNADGQVYAQLKDVRLAAYEGASQVEGSTERHPILRVLWKPDIIGVGLEASSKPFETYLMDFRTSCSKDIASIEEGPLKLAAALDLLTHKNPTMSILELGNNDSQLTSILLDTIRESTAFKRFGTYSQGYIEEGGHFFAKDISTLALADRSDREKPTPQAVKPKFHLIILPQPSSTDKYLGGRLKTIKQLLVPGGLLLAYSPSTAELHSAQNGFSKIQLLLHNGKGCIILAQHLFEERPETNEYGVMDRSRTIFVVQEDGNDVLSNAIAEEVSKAFDKPIERKTLHEICSHTIAPRSLIISTIELKRPVLSAMTSDEMGHIKALTDNASTLVWVTGGGAFTGQSPDHALVSGLSRAVMLEQPSLKFLTFDVDDYTKDPNTTARNIISVLKQAEDRKGIVRDFEFVQANGSVHVSRFVPEENMNEYFRTKQGAEATLTRLEAAKPSKLGINVVGQFDTLYFKQESFKEVEVPLNHVEVEVKAVGLNAKDLYVLGGKIDTKNGTCALEFSGIVTKVGKEVTNLTPGDRVVVMAPSHFRTSEVVPQWACEKLLDGETYAVVSTLSVVFATALYALYHRAHIQPRESILIHCGAGGVGIAAIQIAKIVGAEIFTTVSTDDKKRFLVDTFGIKEENVFNSRDNSFLPGILEATGGRGVDVVLNSLTGDLLHDSWRACASFGRFVEIGKRDIIDSGKLDMQVFLRNVTFTAFDMSELYYHENLALNQLWSNLLAEVMSLFRAQKIRPIEPLRVFDVSDLAQAFRYFSSKNRMGKVAISLQNPDSKIKFLPLKYNCTFSSKKWYLLIGCLGGLGASMSKWMVNRGVRKFVFLGRTGTDRESARRLVEALEDGGAEVKVVRGDVCSYADVQRATQACDGLIGGVIQAAMGLNEALFTTMSNQHWHTGIDPKVQGSWNIHNAIRGKDAELDFFLMTSSVSGSVGTATESNYCAANYFLDQFARYRRTLGLPALSLGFGMISEVGYLHENPEIEALLLRKGIQAINEDEMLQIADIALSATSDYLYDSGALSHILTGLEPLGLIELRKRGFETTNPTLSDPRASLLAGALDGKSDMELNSREGNLPSEVASALENSKTQSIYDAVLSLIVKRFSNLVLIAVDKVDAHKPLTAYGFDSMIGSEFRTWFYQAFKVDVPFLLLLSKDVTLHSLATIVNGEIVAHA